MSTHVSFAKYGQKSDEEDKTIYHLLVLTVIQIQRSKLIKNCYDIITKAVII